jgi:hypothetical protein
MGALAHGVRIRTLAAVAAKSNRGATIPCDDSM